MPSTSESMPLGIVVERRDIDHPWQSHSWRAVAVIPGAPEIDAPRLLRRGDGRLQYHAATLPVVLHRTETEGYKHNITNEKVPMVYVVLRSDDEDEGEDAGGGDMPRPFFVTACPYEASVYLDATGTGEIVDPVPMPDEVIAWVDAYVAKHHVEQPFEKKGKKRWFALHERIHQSAHRERTAARGEPRHD